MPLPRRLARINRVVTNRIFAPLAGRVPPWILLEHTGRRSGRQYRTVAMAFPTANGGGRQLAIALTYGESADWVQNILAAQSGRVKWAGRWRTITAAHLLHGRPALALLPLPVRLFLSMVGVEAVLRLRIV
ncbi:MAG TPA: nitroreductase family deazaflavin-dependent oxidoreductase [Chloroflexota bacterium]|jgi:deazaflavin-dependent oxidoreductase (nitroreductase family)|nr:nitroreductase family deazaflavin-dependent oxidoreductase [Chloroflexota bacterium]